MAENLNINPRNNSYLLGQTEAENMFLKAWKTAQLHHAWILSGRKGVGKATLAYRIARFLLYADENKKEEYSSLNVPENSPIFRQVADGSYPDLKVLERGFIETDRGRRFCLYDLRRRQHIDGGFTGDHQDFGAARLL